MPEDSLQRDALAESGNVGVVTDTIASPLSVVGVSNVGGVASRQVPMCPFQHVSQSAGVDEQSLPYAFSVAPCAGTTGTRTFGWTGTTAPVGR